MTSEQYHGDESGVPTDEAPFNEDVQASDDTEGSGSADKEQQAAAPKRKRGPNKPKPGLFTVKAEASLNQEQILEVLRARAAAEPTLKDVAASMELQINLGAGWVAPDLVHPNGAIIRFATKSE